MRVHWTSKNHTINEKISTYIFGFNKKRNAINFARLILFKKCIYIGIVQQARTTNFNNTNNLEHNLTININ